MAGKAGNTDGVARLETSLVIWRCTISERTLNVIIQSSTYHIHAAISGYSYDGIEHTKIYPDYGHFCSVLVVDGLIGNDGVSVGGRRINELQDNLSGL
jgi:hypothetical protein